MKNYDEIIERHKLFWEKAEVKRPLLINVYDWVDGPRLIDSVSSLPSGCLKSEDIRPRDFIPELEKIRAEGELVNDDRLPMTEPLSCLPWMEAFFGCQVNNTDRHMWSKSSLEGITAVKEYMKKGPSAAWKDAYFEFMKTLQNYSKDNNGRWGVAQPILRGIADVSAAIMGTEPMIFALYDEPELMEEFFGYISKNMKAFFEENLERLEPFHGGYILGQYFIWAPEKCLRIQDDAMAVLSPSLYSKFIMPLNRKIASISKYNAIHLHLTAAHVLDQITAAPEIKAVEYDIDEGSAKASQYVDDMKKIQAAGKAMIIKARFNREDLEVLAKNLSYRGLCLIPVTRNKQEAQDTLAFFEQ